MKNQFSIIIIFLIITLLTSCSNTITLDSSQWRGPNRDGKFPDKNLLKEWPENGPALVWKFDQLGKGYTSPAFTSDRFYITGTTDSIGSVFCFDHKGNLNWKKEYGKEWLVNFPGSRSTPTIAGELGYVLSGLGVLYCFNAENGDNVWTIDLMEEYGGQVVRFGITEVLTVDGDIIYCTPGGIKSNILALNRFTGDLIWESMGSGKSNAYCPITIFTHNGTKYLGTVTAMTAMAINAANGEVAWTYPTENKAAIHGNSPIYRDGFLFIMNGWGNGSFMLKISDDGKSVERAWKNNLMDLENGDAILIDDNLYGANWTEKGVSCVDWNTGEEKFANKDFASGTLCYADGLFYLYGINGKIGLLRATNTTLTTISSFQLEGKKSRDHSAHPVIYDKKLYLRYDSLLWVYDISI